MPTTGACSGCSSFEAVSMVTSLVMTGDVVPGSDEKFEAILAAVCSCTIHKSTAH
jgi:hypothetical protein